MGYARHLVQYRLGIYPPGVTDSERSRLRAWHGSPVWSLLLWLFSAVVLSCLDLHPVIAAAVAGAVTGGAVMLAAHLAAPMRTRMR